MNGGIEMLLARMDTHPEEFTAEVKYGASKWSDLIQQFKHCLPEEDMEAFKNKLNEVQAQHFTVLVMEELIDPKSEKSKWGDTVLDGQKHSQAMAIQQAYLAQQQAAIQQAQAAQATNAYLGNSGQQLTSPYSNLVSDGRGYLSSLFGGKK